MPTGSFGSAAITSGYTEGYVRSSGSLETARVCVDGTRPMRIHHLRGWVSGRGATRSLQMYLGGSTVNLSRAAAGSAQSTGTRDSTNWSAFSGNSVNYGYRNLSGSCYFGRSSGSAINTFGAYGNFTGTLGMEYQYAESPTAPTILSVASSPDGIAATLLLGAPSDDGGAPLTGYQVQRAEDAGFTTGVVTTPVPGSPVVIGGLTPGVRYWWRATAGNEATDEAGKLGGAWSGVVSAQQEAPGGAGLIRASGAWVPGQALIRSGGVWVPPAYLIRSGGAWVNGG